MGGAEHSLKDIMVFASKRADCHLSVTEDGELVKTAREIGVKTHIISCKIKEHAFLRQKIFLLSLFYIKDIISFLFYVFRLRKLVKNISPDIIHANVPKSHIALFLIKILGYRGRCFYHFREIFPKYSLPFFIYSILFTKKDSSIIAISNAVKNYLPATLRNKVEVIYNGVEIKIKDYKENYNCVNFLYLGRVVPWKGCHLLIEIFYELCKRYSNKNIALSIVGDTIYWNTNYRDMLRNLIEKYNLNNRCFLMQYSTDIFSVFSKHDVFCNASYLEPFGRAIAEAQGAGLPVVAFDSGGVSEIVQNGETGFLIPYGDINGFADAMYNFIKQPMLIKIMGQKGSERAKRFFNKEIQIPLIVDHLLKN